MINLVDRTSRNLMPSSLAHKPLVSLCLSCLTMGEPWDLFGR